MDDKKMKGLTKDFQKRNQKSASLGKYFPTKYKYTLISRSEFEKLIEIGEKEAVKAKKEFEEKDNEKRIIILNGDNIWKQFYNKYPDSNGIYTFTRIGFSLNKKFAAVDVYGEGGSWDSQETYILVKNKGRWNVYEAFGGYGVS